MSKPQEQATEAPAQIDIRVNRPGRLRRAGTVVGVSAVAYLAASQFGGDIVNEEVDQQETAIEVVVEEVKPIDIRCFAAARSAVDSTMRTKLSVVGKNIGPTGYKASMEANAETMVCYDGSFITTTVNQSTGNQMVSIDRAGKRIFTEWDGIDITTDVEGAIAESGDLFAGLADTFGIDRFKDAINKNKAELGGVLESASKSALEDNCIDQLGPKLEEVIKDGVLLQADNQDIDRSTVTVVFTGSQAGISPVDFGIEAGRFGFDVTENTIEDIRCSVDEQAFAYAEIETAEEPVDVEPRTNFDEKDL